MDDGFREDITHPTVALAKEGMRAQLRDVILEILKREQNASRLAWPDLPEEAQLDIINRVDRAVTEQIAVAVQLMAADGRLVVVGNIEQMVVKDGLKLTIKTPHTESNLLVLGGHVKGAVLLVIADDKAFLGGEKREPEPSQRPLPLDTTNAGAERETPEEEQGHALDARW